MARRRRLDSFTGELPREKTARLIGEMVALRSSAYAACLTDDGWDAFLRARVLHPRYSWRNCALIAYQAPDSYAVATFAQWRAQGYVVRTGEHSQIRIARGMRSTCSLFDVTQTDCPPPDHEEELLPDDFATTLERLRAAVSRPLTLDDLSRAGEGVQLAYERLTGAQEV